MATASRSLFDLTASLRVRELIIPAARTWCVLQWRTPWRRVRTRRYRVPIAVIREDGQKDYLVDLDGWYALASDLPNPRPHWGRIIASRVETED